MNLYYELDRMIALALQLPLRWPSLETSLVEVGSLLISLLVLVLLYILTRNYLRLRSEPFHPDLQRGEEILEKLTANRLLSQTENVLTNHRILQFHKHWLLSRRFVHSLALQDATQVTFYRSISLYLLALLILLLGYRPLALVLFMFVVERRLYAVRFETQAFFYLWPRVAVESTFPSQLGPLDHFYRQAQLAWAARRVERGMPASIPERTIRETELRWGRPVWIAVGVYAVAAILQRTFQPHISFNDFIFAPLYLGIPPGLARRGRHEAVWSALFGVAMVIAIAFPGVFAQDFPTAYLTEYLFLLAAVTVIALAASALAHWVHFATGFAALVLWPALVALYNTPLFFDHGLYVRTGLAMAVAVLVGMISRPEDDGNP